MKVFNSIQIAAINVSSPIWLNLLYNASFTLHAVAFWIGLVVALIAFVWSIVGIASTMD